MCPMASKYDNYILDNEGNRTLIGLTIDRFESSMSRRVDFESQFCIDRR